MKTLALALRASLVSVRRCPPRYPQPFGGESFARVTPFSEQDCTLLPGLHPSATSQKPSELAFDSCGANDYQIIGCDKAPSQKPYECVTEPGTTDGPVWQPRGSTHSHTQALVARHENRGAMSATRRNNPQTSRGHQNGLHCALAVLHTHTRQPTPRGESVNPTGFRLIPLGKPHT